MSRMKKPGWNACEELKAEKIKNKERTLKCENSSGMTILKKKTLTRARKNEMPAVKEIIKQKLPKLQSTEVRRFRIPYHESVILELEEENLPIAANYLRRFFQLDEDLMKISENPALKNNEHLINLLRNGLTIANRAREKRELLTETASFLEMALSFEKESSEWWWIAQELFKIALENIKKFKSDSEETETILNYFYGRFLQKLNEFESSLKYLTFAWNKSRDKKWNASKISGMRQKSVFTETCILLYNSYLILGKELRNSDPEKAVQSCLEALEKAQESDCEEFIANALCELGKCELNVENTKGALQNFSKFLALMKRLKNPEGICNAHKLLAFSYQQIKDDENTMKHFRIFQELATEYELPLKLAEAHFFTGEYLLNQDKPKLATPYLEYSASLFGSLNDTKSCDIARFFAGVSKGEEVMGDFMKLILESREKNSKAMEKLCNWRNSNEPFWIEETTSENFEEEFDNNCQISESEVSVISESSAVKNLEESQNQEIEIETEKKELSNLPKIQEIPKQKAPEMEIIEFQNSPEASQHGNDEIHIH